MAITNQETTSGITTTFDGAGPSRVLYGRELVGQLSFSGAVATIEAEILIAGLWTPITTGLTADQPFVTFAGPLVRPRQFRFNCTAYTSGNVIVSWSV